MTTAASLDELRGLDSAKRVVLGLARGSAVQSVLFYGLEGSGKRALADVLAKSWLCLRSDGGACGECQSCVAFERGRAVDILRIEPKGASRIVRIAAITSGEPDEDYPVSAQLFLRTPPLAARAKVVIIEEAERMNPQAANSLLKTLEEPPSYGRFILLTEAVGSMLPTILSRCLAVACEVPAECPGVEDWAFQLSGGALIRAQEIQDLEALYRPIYDFAIGLPRRARAEALVASEAFGDLADRLQEGRKMNARGADAEALEVLGRAYRFAAGARPEALQAIAETHRRILGNANAASALDALFTAILTPQA